MQSDKRQKEESQTPHMINMLEMLNSHTRFSRVINKIIDIKLSNLEKWGVIISGGKSPQDVYKYIINSNNYELLKKYVMQEDHHKLYHLPVHGVRHVDNVTLYSLKTK